MKHIGTDPNAVAAYDDDKVQSNIALLGFKTAVNGSLAKYNLQDQIIDEYEDATGIDAGASTNESLLSGVYSGTVNATQDADDTGTDGDYTWYKWTDTAATGSITTGATLDVEYLMVGGGGSSGNSNPGGAGAGGVLAATGLELTGGNTYTVTVGAGGTRPASGAGDDGDDSILSGTGISTLTAGGGGGGGCSGASATEGRAGRATNGSAGGGAWNNNGGSGDGTGGDGGNGSGNVAPQYGSGGGGGAGANGAVGTGSTGGDGGDGVANDIIETGTDVYYGGGGGGSTNGNVAASGDGGNGGGGDAQKAASPAVPEAGTDGLGGGGGGGGGGSTPYGDGGSGVVILRGLTSELNISNDLTLQSTDTTAMTEPDYADMVVLMENDTGTATINVDIKGYISKDSGSTFTEGTLVDEGTWGTNKKVYAFHDLDISAQSGTSMCYKITTHNQSVSKITKIHATSIGWKV